MSEDNNGATSPAPEVLVTWPDYSATDHTLGGSLTAAGCQLNLNPKRGPRRPQEMRDLARNATAAIVSTDPFDEHTLAACPHLRVIARVGVGVDSIDLDAATRLGIIVTVTPGANENAVAEHTVGLILALVRRIAEHDGAIRRGEWNRTGEYAPWELAGCTVGLVGFGQIGQLVAQRLAGFDVEVLHNDPAHSDSGHPGFMPLDTLLRRSDVVSVHAPLLPSTRHLLGRRELSLMKPHALLINTARGGVVDEQALIDALEAQDLRGAGLDVFEEEPPRSARLLKLANVVLSPHVGGISDRSTAAMTKRATESVLAVLGGRRPPHVANGQVLAHPRAAALLAPERSLAGAVGTERPS